MARRESRCMRCDCVHRRDDHPSPRGRRRSPSLDARRGGRVGRASLAGGQIHPGSRGNSQSRQADPVTARRDDAERSDEEERRRTTRRDDAERSDEEERRRTTRRDDAERSDEEERRRTTRRDDAERSDEEERRRTTRRDDAERSDEEERRRTTRRDDAERSDEEERRRTARQIGRVTVLTNPASGHGNAPHA